MAVVIRNALVKDKTLNGILNKAVERALAFFPEKHHERIHKAHDIILNGEILVLHNGDAVVESSQNNGQTYHIIQSKCACPDATYRSFYCKHEIARMLVIRADEIYQSVRWVG
jgi:hypothetical protein